MYLTETLYRFCTRPDSFSRYQQNRDAYDWILKHWIDNGDESVSRNTFRAVLLYMVKTGKAPASIEALEQWVIHNPSQDSEFKKSMVVESELRDLKDHEPSDLDDDVLFDALLNKARAQWAENTYRVAMNVATGSTKVPGSKNPDLFGVTESIKWLRGQLANDFTPEAPVVDGKLDENIPTILQSIESRLTTSSNGKFALGLPHIDRNVVVGRQNLRFLGILGMSGDGKTTLTNFITYNWLRQGAHILYVSTEHSPAEIWDFMAWLHQSHPDYDFALPPMQDWEGGRETGRVTRQDENNLIRILSDIQARKNLPGMLDCKSFRDWDSIKDYLDQNQKKNRYDILVVDYLSRLNTPGDQRFRNDQLKAMVHDAQGLTREFDEQRGLVLLTPLQVNRESNKHANSIENESSPRYDLNAISTISEYQHDLDLCLSVWSDVEMRMDDEIEVGQCKERKGRRSLRQRMVLNRNSGAFEYPQPAPTSPSVGQQWDKSVEDVMSTTMAIDADNWGV
jgi:KaiC/GvpD/RAD55 family RecA-like ATPase